MGRQGKTIPFMLKTKNHMCEENTENTAAPGRNRYRNLNNSSGYLPDTYLQPFSSDPWNNLVIVEQQDITSGK